MARSIPAIMNTFHVSCFDQAMGNFAHDLEDVRYNISKWMRHKKKPVSISFQLSCNICRNLLLPKEEYSY